MAQFVFAPQERVCLETWEVDEQKCCRENIKPDDCVLELGGRYGVVSYTIQQILSDKKKHVVVEPDTFVHPYLERNRDDNKCEYHILKGIVSADDAYCFGFGAGKFTLGPDVLKINNEHMFRQRIGDFSVVKGFTWDNIEESFGMKFNVIIADMEGSFPGFIKDNVDKLEQINTIIYEQDGIPPNQYQDTENLLISKGFSLVNMVGGQRIFKRLN